jgi:hypothetical protein
MIRPEKQALGLRPPLTHDPPGDATDDLYQPEPQANVCGWEKSRNRALVWIELAGKSVRQRTRRAIDCEET